MSVENDLDDLWIGVKGQSNPVIAGSPRNILRYSVVISLDGGRALTGLGAPPGYQPLSNSECRLDDVMQSGCGCEGPRPKGKQPRPTAKVSKSMLSGKGGGVADTSRRLA